MLKKKIYQKDYKYHKSPTILLKQVSGRFH